MKYKTSRPNLQVYIKGQLEPLIFEGEYLVINDTKIEKIVDKIEGVTRCEEAEPENLIINEKSQNKKKDETEESLAESDEIDEEVEGNEDE